jgi:hypothetical protein
MTQALYAHMNNKRKRKKIKKKKRKLGRKNLDLIGIRTDSFFKRQHIAM